MPLKQQATINFSMNWLSIPADAWTLNSARQSGIGFLRPLFSNIIDIHCGFCKGTVLTLLVVPGRLSLGFRLHQECSLISRRETQGLGLNNENNRYPTLKNAATALGKSSVRQIKTNGPKLKWLYGQERLRWGKEKKKKRKEKEESQVNFSYFGN